MHIIPAQLWPNYLKKSFPGKNLHGDFKNILHQKTKYASSIVFTIFHRTQSNAFATSMQDLNSVPKAGAHDPDCRIATAAEWSMVMSPPSICPASKYRESKWVSNMI
jgi:hypothetical protein